MVIRIITIMLFPFLVNSCWFFGISCKDDYNAVRKHAEVRNLFSISPLKEVYTRGDLITFSSYLYSSELYYEEYFWGIDSNYSLRSYYSVSNFITDNEYEIVKGFVNEYGQACLEYNQEDDSYELEIQIKLLRTGQYFIHGYDFIRFKGKQKCDLYDIDTSIIGTDEFGHIKFYVEE